MPNIIYCVCIWLLVSVSVGMTFGQPAVPLSNGELTVKGIVAEGNLLYQLDSANRTASELFLKQFPDRRTEVSGFFSYHDLDGLTTVFVSGHQVGSAVATIRTPIHSSASATSQARLLNAKERSLWAMREVAIDVLRGGTLYKFYEGMTPVIIPVSDERGKRAYVLTKSEKPDVAVFGNDYLLTFDSLDQLVSKKPIHRTIMTVEYGADSANPTGAMHTHVPETGELITPTDVYVLRRHETRAAWRQHFVVAPEKVSVWNCRTNTFVVLPRAEWDQIFKEQNHK